MQQHRQIVTYTHSYVLTCHQCGSLLLQLKFPKVNHRRTKHITTTLIKHTKVVEHGHFKEADEWKVVKVEDNQSSGQSRPRASSICMSKGLKQLQGKLWSMYVSN